MMLLNSFFQKIKKFYHLKILRKKYYRFGKCLKCGCCCENIYVRHGKNVIKSIEEFDEIKNNDSYSFYQHISVIGQNEFGLIFECQKFDKEKRICKNHKNRPSICVNYPSEEIFMMGANLKEGCGYRFEPIEKFDEVFKKVCAQPLKEFKEFVEDDSWEEFRN